MYKIYYYKHLYSNNNAYEKAKTNRRMRIYQQSSIGKHCDSTYDSGNVSKTTKAIVLDLKPLHALSKLALLISTSMVYY